MARKEVERTKSPNTGAGRGPARSDRRALALAERRQAKKTRAHSAPPSASGPDLYTWMAELLPSGGGRVLQVGPDGRSTAALAARGWRVVPIEAAAVLAEGAFTGEPVDAVTCWLLDLRDARLAAVEKLKAMGLRTADEKRLAVVTLIYRLADRVLRVGGTLQVVERMSEAFGEALATGMVRLQRAQAKGTGLGFAALDARPELGGAVVSVRSTKQ